MNNAPVNHYPERRAFEIELADEPAVLEYRMMDGDLALLHTYVPPSGRGQGLADELARSALEYARSEKLPVRPYCPFVRKYLQRHPDAYADLVVREIE